ncbi:MAG: TIGR03000 domain-containing protein [Gemmataceae bacterium]
MYSVVLMAALSTGAADVNCHWGCGWRSHGCYSCYGCYGCYGCGGCYGCYGCYGCGGCYGCYGGYGRWSNYAPIMIEQQPAEKIPAPMKEEAKPKPNEQARIIITVPEGAKLYIDNKLMKTEGTERVFRTPVLDSKQTYFYEVRTEVMRDGKMHTDAQRVVFKSGQEVRAEFKEPAVATASAEK